MPEGDTLHRTAQKRYNAVFFFRSCCRICFGEVHQSLGHRSRAIFVGEQLFHLVIEIHKQLSVSVR